MLEVVAALASARRCPCDCHATLTLDERVAGIRAIYRLDDALRGWGYLPTYEIHGDVLWREAQQRNDATYRGVAVRFGECIYRRLLGSLLHECIHAVCGDVNEANYGVLFGLPYAVPKEVPEKDEETFLDPFNFAEARAWLGVGLVGQTMFGLDWDLRTAREVGTYCFVGGNALVPGIAGYRSVAHIDRQHHPARYATRASAIQERARVWFDSGNTMADVIRQIDEASARGAKRRARAHADPLLVAKTPPKKTSGNDPCTCGSRSKFNLCCATQSSAPSAEALSR